MLVGMILIACERKDPSGETGKAATITSETSGDTPRPVEPPIPEFVTVQLVESIIAPVKPGPNPAAWDCCASGDDVKKASDGLAKLAAMGITSGEPNTMAISAGIAVVTATAPAAGKASSLPDPFGLARLKVPSGEVPPLRIDSGTDTIVANWHVQGSAAPVEWRNVRLSDDVRLEVQVLDRDIAQNDQVGTVELTRTNLVAAYRSGGKYYVPNPQLGGGLLFTAVSVTPQAAAR
jgi:hypothetical protein